MNTEHLNSIENWELDQLPVGVGYWNKGNAVALNLGFGSNDEEESRMRWESIAADNQQRKEERQKYKREKQRLEDEAGQFEGMHKLKRSEDI